MTRCLDLHPARTALTYPRASQQCGGAHIYLNREDLAPRRAHKSTRRLDRPVGERMEQTRIIAETGAGQHCVGDLAAVCAMLGMHALSIWSTKISHARSRLLRNASWTAMSWCHLLHQR